MKLLINRTLSDNRYQLDALDGMRGMAALIVLFSHTSAADLYFFPRADFSGIGKSGVYLFFLLSSFLLTYPFISNRSEMFSKNKMLSYATRRIFRIYPLYFVYLLAAIVSTPILSGFFNFPAGLPFALNYSEFLPQLLLLQARGVEWSVIVEFKYYFLLPLIAFAYSILLKNAVILCALMTAICVTGCVFIWPPSSYEINDTRLGIYLPIFLIGSFLAVLHDAVKQSEIQARHKWMIEIAGVISILLIVLMIPSVNELVSGRSVYRGTFHKEFTYYALLWSVILFSAIHGAGYIKKFFELTVLRYVGLISFSVYLTHTTLIKIIHKFGLLGVAGAWTVLLSVIAISTITYRLIELPASNIRLHRDKRAS